MPALLLAIAALAPSANSLPTLSFVHSGLIERYCASTSTVKPDEHVLAEIDEKMPEFRAAWAAEGPKLMAANVAATGRPYLFRETVATLHACRDMPSYSAPFLLAVAQFTATGASLAPVAIAGLERNGSRVAAPASPGLPPMSGFTYLVWHESTHRYINDIIDQLPGRTTPLLTKYATEDGVALSHLHLFALEQIVYRRLGREKEWAERNARLRARGFKSAVRAVDIVGIETAERLVAELRRP